jgi:hypothetical protein
MLSRPRLFDRILVLADIAAGPLDGTHANATERSGDEPRSPHIGLNDPMERTYER